MTKPRCALASRLAVRLAERLIGILPVVISRASATLLPADTEVCNRLSPTTIPAAAASPPDSRRSPESRSSRRLRRPRQFVVTKQCGQREYGDCSDRSDRSCATKPDLFAIRDGVPFHSRAPLQPVHTLMVFRRALWVRLWKEG